MNPEQIAERAAHIAERELRGHEVSGLIEPTCDWDTDFARFYGTAPPTIQAPEV